MKWAKGASLTGDAQKSATAPEPDATLLATAADPHSGSLTLWLVALRAHHPAITRALAANPTSPRSLLGLIGRLGRWDVAALVASNPRCTGGLYRRFVMSPHWAVVAAVAGSPSAPGKLLGQLAGRPDARIAMAVAGNPRLPPEAVAALLRSPSDYIRGVAAANPAAQAEDLRLLAAGMAQPAWILRAIAANPSCPEGVSDQLLTWITLGGPGKADPLFDPVKCTGHPGTTDEPVMAWYSEQARQREAHRHPLWRVRAMYPPMRPKLQLSVLGELRRDPRPEVRRTLAGAIGVRPRYVRELMGDADPIVARVAVRVRSANRKRYLRRRVPKLGRLTLRLAPLILVGVTLALTNLRGTLTTPSVPLSSPNFVEAAPTPFYRSGSCAAAPTWMSALSGAAGTAVPVISPAAVGLPGGGWMACGPTAGGPEAMLVSAGSTGLAVLVSETVRLTDGSHYTNATVHVPAAHKVVLYLPDNPQVAAMTIIAADRPSFVITATLTFSSRAS